MILLSALFAAAWPVLVWQGETKPSVAGLELRSPADLAGYTALPPPKIERRMNVASATTVPWIDANGWRFVRGLRKVYYKQVPEGRAALAAAEAFAYGGEAAIEAAPADLDKLAHIVAFFRSAGDVNLPPMANIGVIDDGSPALGEVLNLLGRRNLLYRVVREPDPALQLNIRLGSKDFPAASAANPNDFAARVREKLTDEKRLLRVYNSYTVLAHLTGDGTRARLHLLNYSPRPAEDVRVRVLGLYKEVRLLEADGLKQAKDVSVLEGGTEFTVPRLTTYAIVDLEKK